MISPLIYTIKMIFFYVSTKYYTINAIRKNINKICYT